MKRVYQRVTDHDPANGLIGDCFRAATASILSMDLDEVPHFAEMSGPEFEAEKFWSLVFAWFQSKGIKIFLCEPLTAEKSQSMGFWGRHHYILGRTSHRGRLVGHTLIGMNGHIIHDPDPTKPRLVHGVEWHGYLLDMNGAPV